MKGETIRRIRTLAGMSQDSFARACGVTRQTVSMWETERTKPERENELRIAQIGGFGTPEEAERWVAGLNLRTQPSPAAKPPGAGSAEYLDQLIRAIGAQNPDLILQIRAMARSVDQLTEQDIRILAQAISLAYEHMRDRVSD